MADYNKIFEEANERFRVNYLTNEVGATALKSGYYPKGSERTEGFYSKPDIADDTETKLSIIYGEVLITPYIIDTGVQAGPNDPESILKTIRFIAGIGEHEGVKVGPNGSLLENVWLGTENPQPVIASDGKPTTKDVVIASLTGGAISSIPQIWKKAFADVDPADKIAEIDPISGLPIKTVAEQELEKNAESLYLGDLGNVTDTSAHAYVLVRDGCSGEWITKHISDVLIDEDVLTCEGGGIEEAPEDGKQYARQDATWTEVVPGDSGIPEAPNDGLQYARQSEQWSTIVSDSIGEAPNDGECYVRRNEGWSLLDDCGEFLTATFTFDATGTDYIVDFTDTSSPGPNPPIVSWFWEFGDGATSTLQNPSHDYGGCISYLYPTLTITDSVGQKDTTSVALELCPIANFTCSNTSGTVITYSNKSIPGRNPPITYLWDFDGYGTSTDEHPLFDFGEYGTFSTTLTVTDALGIQDSFTSDCSAAAICPTFPPSGSGEVSSSLSTCPMDLLFLYNGSPCEVFVIDENDVEISVGSTTGDVGQCLNDAQDLLSTYYNISSTYGSISNYSFEIDSLNNAYYHTGYIRMTLSKLSTTDKGLLFKQGGVTISCLDPEENKPDDNVCCGTESTQLFSGSEVLRMVDSDVMVTTPLDIVSSVPVDTEGAIIPADLTIHFNKDSYSTYYYYIYDITVNNPGKGYNRGHFPTPYYGYNTFYIIDESEELLFNDIFFYFENDGNTGVNSFNHSQEGASATKIVDAAGASSYDTPGYLNPNISSVQQITLGTPLTTADGQSLSAGDILLLQNQTNGNHNHIYEYIDSTTLKEVPDRYANDTKGKWTRVLSGSQSGDYQIINEVDYPTSTVNYVWQEFTEPCDMYFNEATFDGQIKTPE